ncbi:hypothetical protein, partial [Klebsiella pneumoniae]|uniref:hypothetical protein n=1 Tax=Klebsiella pneumoniae TaxID=573 RepID=UPI0030131133
IKQIEAQATATADQTILDAWKQAVMDVGKTTGIWFIDLWNGCIRPLLATVALAVVLFEVIKNGFALSDWDRELVGAILGVYVADRSLVSRG